MAESRGLKIALEPLNRFESDLINTAGDALRLIHDIGHPAAGILLDGFHVNIEEASIQQAVMSAGDKRSEEQTSELQSLMRNSYAVFCLNKQKSHTIPHIYIYHF